jgi:hypothetical protein
VDNWREIPEGLLLWRCQGKRDEARDLPTPVYGWFTEGFDTRDLKRLRRCLTNLPRVSA